ncbi:MAG: DNA methyltransferase [Gallionellaceae bacterium]
MSAPKELTNLIERFGQHADDYRKGKYNETQLRRDYLDSFLRALGWDVDNTQGYAEAYREVVHEDAVRISGNIKSPDYSCRIGGTRKFFVEAKRPSIVIKDLLEPAFQLRRYAWSAKLPLSILTNFEEFAVYDCRVRPHPNDKAATARIHYWTFKDYLEKWDEIASIFSKEAVLKGSFDKYAAAGRGKKGTTEVDAAFLDEIEGWREALAKDIASNNNQLSQRELNWSVQQTIDRIIFLRIAEDRGLEPYGQLQALQNSANVYARMKELFGKADDRYNSGLFHFKKEHARSEEPDRLTPILAISDKTLKDIFKHLYYPDSPYEFSVLEADILGSVYERFLGKVIRLTAGHHAKIEEKPEVKKAGGIYYTPTYIVDYIVKNTVGKLLIAKSPKEAEKLRILDPACGSGSFLIGAYQYLLDWHRDWYVNDDAVKYAKGKNPKLHQARGGGWRLTTAERKRILLNNIYGVDIDSQAVEVTKLSLLLKVLEGETQLEMFHERVLPDLGNNIKCGNSLIDTAIYQTQLIPIDDVERSRINAFDWKKGFPEIIKAGGFDIVIGNPPYRRELDYKELMDEIASTDLGRRFRSPRMDLWYYFVHRGLEILRTRGLLSFIVNAYWVAGTGAEKLISQLQEHAHIDEIFFFGNLKVFQNVSGQHMVIRIINTKLSTDTIVKTVEPSGDEKTAEPFFTGHGKIVEFKKKEKELFKSGKIDIQPCTGELLAKIEKWPQLFTFGLVRQGIAENPSSVNKKTNEKYGNKWTVGEGVFVLKPEEVRMLKLTPSEKQLLRPYHDLCDLGRYYLAPEPSCSLIYSTKTTCPRISEFPSIRSHLARFKQVMDSRRETMSGANSWWHLHWPRDENIWRAHKVISIQMSSRPSFVCADEPVYVPFSVNVFVPNIGVREHLNYFTAILNSKLLWEWFRHHAKRRGVGLEINGNVLQNAPIRAIDFQNSVDTALHDQTITLVNQMLLLNRKIISSKTPHEQETFKRQMVAIDQEIDKLVYELYGLDEEDISTLERT